jgi:hypothetical protein
MCRNIKTLFNFAPPATDEEIRAASIQFVRKLSGCSKPSKANEAAFARAVDEVTAVAQELLGSMVTTAPPRDRKVEELAARARSAKRFGPTVARERVVSAPTSSKPRGQARPRKPRSADCE